VNLLPLNMFAESKLAKD